MSGGTGAAPAADGFYWIVVTICGQKRVVVAELSGGEWFLPGYEGPDPADAYAPISARIEPPAP